MEVFVPRAPNYSSGLLLLLKSVLALTVLDQEVVMKALTTAEIKFPTFSLQNKIIGLTVP